MDLSYSWNELRGFGTRTPWVDSMATSLINRGSEVIQEVSVISGNIIFEGLNGLQSSRTLLDSNDFRAGFFQIVISQ